MIEYAAKAGADRVELYTEPMLRLSLKDGKLRWLLSWKQPRWHEAWDWD